MVGKRLPIGENTGTIVPFEYQKTWTQDNGKKVMVLGRHSGIHDVILTLPSGLKTGDLAWLSIWCRKLKIDLGHVVFKGSDKLHIYLVYNGRGSF